MIGAGHKGSRMRRHVNPPGGRSYGAEVMQMATADPTALHALKDVIRLQDRRLMQLRAVEADDVTPLAGYLCSLSPRTRYNRFLGARQQLSEREIAGMLDRRESNMFALIGEIVADDGSKEIICEARFGFNDNSGECEFGLSVADRWQGQGIGNSVVANVECRVAALGAKFLLGDTFRDNAAMLALARKRAFATLHSPGDWRLIRLRKPLPHFVQDIPCASWRAFAEARAIISAR